jgi:hypothetical protein
MLHPLLIEDRFEAEQGTEMRIRPVTPHKVFGSDRQRIEDRRSNRPRGGAFFEERLEAGAAFVGQKRGCLVLRHLH